MDTIDLSEVLYRSLILNVSSPVIKVAEIPVLWVNFLNDAIIELKYIIDNNEKLKTERQEPSPEDTQRVNNFLAKHYDRFTTQYPELSDISFEQFKHF